MTVAVRGSPVSRSGASRWLVCWLVSLLGIALPLTAMADGERSVERTLISSGSKWEDLAGYSRAVVQGDWIFVSGTVGVGPDGTLPGDVESQMDNIFAILSATLTKADATLGDIVRVRCYAVDAASVERIGPKLRQYLGEVRPANTTVITELAVPGAFVEIEVTALRRP